MVRATIERPGEAPREGLFLHPPRKRRRTRKQGRYHHGDLRNAAIRRGREIVALHGPSGVTLRGVARDLGVTAPALLYYFGSRSGLRAAVAESVREDLAKLTDVECGGRNALPAVRSAGQRLFAFARDNPYLYRLASGEGWHGTPKRPLGGDILAGPPPIARLNRRFQRTLERGQISEHVRPGDARADAYVLMATVHGLALAVTEGASGALVEQAYASVVEGLAGPRQREPRPLVRPEGWGRVNGGT